MWQNDLLSPKRIPGHDVLILYSITIFASAALLFAVEPMIAKMVLPLLGGAPAVWNTCLLFFQAILLAGYAYVHFGSEKLGLRRFAKLHLVLAVIGLLVLPIGLPLSPNPPTDTAPIGWLLGLLVKMIGLPAFLLSATAPLAQKLFTDSGHKQARDPYFLYAASNLGSLGALLSYPLLIEPTFTTREQCYGWSSGFVLFVGLLCLIIAIAVKRSRKETSLEPMPQHDAAFEPAQPISRKQKLHWLALSIVPSSWLLGTTHHLTMDLAPVPMLWVIPLALYLFTFVIAFRSRESFLGNIAARILPVLVLWLLASSAMFDSWWPIVPHLAVFFFGALACHQELARLRPSASHLTEYYLWMSLGGVIGGAFNAIVAPLLFPILLEYPLAIIAGLFLSWPPAKTSRKWIEPAALALITAIAVWSFTTSTGWKSIRGSELSMYALVLGIPALALLYLCRLPFVFPIFAGVLLFADVILPVATDSTLFVGRSYFGVHRVVQTEAPSAHRLMHGSTIHGMQFIGPTRDTTPLTYYHPSGPLGDLFRYIGEKPIGDRVGVIGLGTGAIAGYATPKRDFTFFEIDPVVAAIAQDPNLFTFLDQLSKEKRHIILGDGRLMLQRYGGEKFGILILDAFSSDSIPIHLLTREAIALYLQKLEPNGIVAFHVSNNYLRLDPVLGDLAGEFGLVCYARRDVEVIAEQIKNGYSPASYVVMAHRREDLLGLDKADRWEEVKPRQGVRVWTDDYSNIFRVLAIPGRDTAR